MCDENPLNVLLGAAAFAVAAAITSLLVAIGLNGSFFGAGGAPGAMIAVAISSGAAAASLTGAIIAMNLWYSCMTAAGTHPAAAVPCKGLLGSFDAAAAAAATVLVLQGWAALAAAGVSWVPGLGLPPMWVILGALIAQSIAIAALVYFWRQTRACILSHP